MNLHSLKPNDGARKARKRLGRGTGSGLGKTSGKGHKGQNARSGGGVRPGFEGGQLPLFQRLPKRGFKNFNKTIYATINVSELNVFEDNSVVTPLELVKNGLVKKTYDGIKVLGDGELTKKLTVKAHKFSKSAEDAIVRNGGSIEVL
jgi:large subunit ribosomal protein L15